MEQLQEHARKHGVLISSQKQILGDYAGLFPIVEVGDPKSPYLPIGSDHESPVEHNVRAADFLFGAAKQRARLINRTMNPGIVVGAANIKPPLIRPQLLARTGERINTVPYMDSPFARVPLERRVAMGDRVGSLFISPQRNAKADNLDLYE